MARAASRCTSVLVGLVLVLVTSGCGGGGEPASEGAPAAPGQSTVMAPDGASTTASITASTARDRSASILPSVTLTNVQTGDRVDLGSLVPAERPTLLWFWAPH